MPKHAGSSKPGRNKVKCARYRSRGRHLINKLKRILKSNGKKAAEHYDICAARGTLSGVRFPRVRGMVAKETLGWVERIEE